MSRRLAGLATVAVMLLYGCGSSSTHSTVAPAAEPAPSTLPARAVPYLPSTLRPLTARLLTREAQAPDLAASLRAWRYESGSDRYFQGESRRLQVVESRTLRFGRASGAAAYVAFMRSHLSTYLGSLPKLREFEQDGRRGFLAIGQECQCHLANPTYLAVLAHGNTVSWLEINGPGASQPRLATLLHRAP
jgi:hypothetical protein